MSFVHLHNHSHYSLLDGLAKPDEMVKKAKEFGQPAMALTDHGNMMGIIDFFTAAEKAKIKPLIGCEVYLTKQSRSIKNKENEYYHLVLIAKNHKGYENLLVMVSEGSLTGFYSKPRVDYDLLEKHSEGLIALSACVGGEIPQAIMAGDYNLAKEIALNYERLFGKDHFYLEIQHHPGITEQEMVNNALIKMSKETGIGLVATNDAHYVNREDNVIQDALLCINTGRKISDENRMCMMGDDYSILSTETMQNYFGHVPEALSNTVKVADMCDLKIEFGQNLVPKFACPNNMTEPEYLRFLAETGLTDRYGMQKQPDGTFILPPEIDEATLPKPLAEIVERMNFEIEVICKMGFPGYFLIVQDFVNWGKNNGVMVGPGRGSAAGAIIAFLLKITNIDPMRYDLLFERFLNPDRISMPDIDIDFQDDGREKVLEYVRNKYGVENVCQVVTYQSMAAKNSIRDIGRVKDIPLPEVNKIANAVPSKPGTTLKKAMEEVEFKKLYNESSTNKELIDMAMRIEGTIRGTGTHACAVIISGTPVSRYTPLQYPPKDEGKTIISQYEGPQLDKIGLLKMDFLGLRNLSIITKCLKAIKKNHGVEIDIDKIPLNDELTLDLYSRGLTHGIFQFESDGMKKYLKDLKPNRFEDLVAMNALYRPGPLQYIPDFIDRKHGRKPIVFDHPLMEKILKDTYGITVYQEQVMLLSRELAGFTRGDSDVLRKAMGKKLRDVMDKLKIQFITGCKNNPLFVDQFKATKDIPDIESLAVKIWTDWESFAEYAFNKSHSVCYAYVSYQTAYLKSHYPREYMAAMLNSVSSAPDKVLEYIAECENLGIEITRPDVNYSYFDFSATKDNKVSFGLYAIKNVGEKALESIIEDREKNGSYKDIYDFLNRIDLTKANKRTLEFLIKAGALDSLGHKRSQLFEALDTLLPHFQKITQQKDEWENSLFGLLDESAMTIEHPPLKEIPEWDKNLMLDQEKEFIGFYVSGHPLDEHKEILGAICLKRKLDVEEAVDKSAFKIGGKIMSVNRKFTKAGNKEWAIVSLMTLYGDEEVLVFSKAYADLKDKIFEGAICIFEARLQKRDESSYSFASDKMLSIEEAGRMLTDKSNTVKISLKPAELDSITTRQLVEYLNTNPGNKELIFNVAGSNSNYFLRATELKVSGNLKFIKGVKEILGEDCISFD